MVAGESSFEVIVGAILTQNTNWGNVERALHNIKSRDLLDPQKLFELPPDQLVQLIRPAGYFNVKARRLMNFLKYLMQCYDGDLVKMSSVPAAALRKELLSVNGIGPETADSILLYAFNKPVFVIDAYTKRMLYRHGIVDAEADYHMMRDLFMDQLPKRRKMFNEYHALIVRVGKEYCKPKARCEQCPLNDCHYSLSVRCKTCYRQLLNTAQKTKTNSGYQCPQCH